MTPAQVHIALQLLSSAGIEPISTVGAPGTQGAGTTGTQGIGVSTPKAAVVAAATVGLARLVHMPKGGMFTMGIWSMMVAAGGPPAAVTAAIRADDVRDLEIWRVGDRMFMILEQGPGHDPDAKAARDAANPDVQAWDALMRTFQKPLPCAPDQTWTEMTRIYALSEQP